MDGKRYYDRIKESVSKSVGVEFMYLGIQYTVVPEKDGILLRNGATGETEIYENFDDLMRSEVMCKAFTTQFSGNIWLGKIENREYVEEEEFIEFAKMGREIEFVCFGVGYFISCKSDDQDKRIDYVLNMHTLTSWEYSTIEELLEFPMNGIPLRECWGKIELICCY